jgi:hypothetical protein
MSGGGSGTQTVNQDPWVGQQPYLKDLFKESQKLYNAPGPDYYPWSGVASLNPDILAGENALRTYANQAAPQMASDAQGALTFGNTGAVLDPSSNPYLAATARAAIRPTTEALLQNVLPQVGSAAQQAGAYGGARQGLVEGNVLNDYMRNTMDTTAGMYSQGYGQGLDYMGKTLALTPQTIQAGALPATYQDQVGQQLRDYEQQLIADEVSRWNYNQQLPYEKLVQYQNTIAGNYGQETTQPGPTKNQPLSVLGGAAAGAAAGSMVAPGYGTAIGAGLGALIGFMS